MFGNLFKQKKRKAPSRPSGFVRFFNHEILPWLRLLHLPRIFTSIGEPLAGACLAAVMAETELSFWTLLDVCFCSIAINAFGMIQNDWCDQAADRRLHPDRPLPQRQIPILAAAAVALACILVALCLAAISGHRVFLVAVTQLILICAYNFTIKKTLVGGAVGMGICRALNVMLGASLVVISPAIFILMLSVGIYAAVLMTFRGYDSMGLRQVPGKAVFMPAGVMLLGWLATLPWTAARGAFLAPFVCIVVSVGVAVYLAIRIYGKAVGRDAIKRFIVLLFLNMIPYQAAWITMPRASNWLVVFVCFAIFWLASYYLNRITSDN